MDQSLGLNEHHHHQMVQYLRFCRYQRGQRLRAVDACFDDVKNSRLFGDTTFTKEEVEELLDGLQTVLHGEAESEFINVAHTNVLLLKQLFKQAEEWHLKLQADLSELENRELLEAIQQFEDKQLSMHADKPVITKLQPLQSGPAELLRQEIDRLAVENNRLKEGLQNTQVSASTVEAEKEKLLKALKEAQHKLRNAKSDTGTSPQELAKMEDQIQSIKRSMEEDLAVSEHERTKLQSDLTGAKRRLLEVQEQLEMAEKELEKKFSQTIAYQNMKKMLTKKNDQLKILRTKLASYEPDDEED